MNLEEPAARAEALSDPGGFLASFRGAGVIIDEVQRAPELTSWLQARVDEDPTPGRYILTGSAHFGVMEQVSQSVWCLRPQSSFDFPPLPLMRRTA